MKYTKKKKKGAKIQKFHGGGSQSHPHNPNGTHVTEAVADPNANRRYYDEATDTWIDNRPYHEQYESGRTENMPLTSLLMGSGAGLGARGLAALGEYAYGALSGPLSAIFKSPLSNPVTGAPVAGGAVTGEALLNTYFAAHGSTNLPGDIADFSNDPSWENAGQIGFDIFEMVPVALDYFVPNAKVAIETASKSKPAQTPIISLESSTAGGIEASLNAVKQMEIKKAYSSYLSKQIESIKSKGVSGILTKDQVEKSIAEVLAYNNEMMQQPKFFEKLLESIKSAELSSSEMIPGTGIKSAAAQEEWLRVVNWRGADVTRFGYVDESVGDVVFFSTPEQTAKAMIDAMKGGDEVLRNAVGRSREYMGRKTGLYKSDEGLTEFGLQLIF